MRLIAILFLLILGWISLAHADGIRLAVIAPDNPDFATLATVELAKVPGVVVVERSEIAAIAKEEALTEAAHSGSWTPLGQLLHADALLIVSRNDLFGTPLNMVRLVAVQPGVVIDSATLAPDATSLPSEAARIVGQFTPLLAKLDSLNIGSALKVSLLGLHFDANSSMAAGSERVLNALLADRLTHRPHILVLERWNLDAAAWEKGIQSEEPSPFWAGSCLVDGRIAEQGSDLQIDLRLRLADADKPILISLTQPANQIAELADALAGRIAAALGVRDAAASWDRKEEALNETLLAHWALGNHLYPDAFEAVATADALCPRTPDIELLRLESETQLAFPHPPLTDMRVSTSYNAARDGVPVLPTQREAAQVALDHLRTLWTLCVDDPVFQPAANRLHLQAMYTIQQVSRLLAAVHDNGSWHQDEAGIGDLRQAVRDTVDLLLQLDLNHQTYAYFHLFPYIAYWFETPEETLTFYRRLLQLPGNPAFPSPWKYPFAWGGMVHPWVVGWHGEDQSKLNSTWSAFLDTLRASPSLQDQVAGWAWKIDSAPYAERTELLPSLADFAWKNRTEITRPDSTTDFSPIGEVLSENIRRGATQNDPSLQKVATDFLPYLLQANAWIRPRTLHAFGLAAVLIAPQEKEKLAAQFAAYRTAMAGSPFLDASSTQELDAVTGAVFGATPEETAGDAEIHFPAHFLGLAEDDGSAANVRDPVASDGRFWFIDLHGRRIIGWDPVADTREAIPYDPALTGPGIDLVVGSRYLFVQVAQQIWEYDRSAKSWTPLDLPPARYTPATTGSHAALLYWQPTGEKENGGLLTLDPVTHTTETVLSSRSNPPRNELDGLPESRGISLHLTEDGQMDYIVKLSTSDQTTGLRTWSDSHDDLYTQKQPGGPWERILSVTSTFTRLCHLTYYPEPQGALLLAQSRLGSTRFPTFCQLILWDRASGRLTLLLANPAAAQPPLPGVAQWEMPADLAATEALLHVVDVPALQDGVLWILRWEGLQEQGMQRAEVYRFKPGSPQGARLTLDFDPTQGLPAGDNRPEERFLRPGNVAADAHGFVLARSPESGAWYLPFSEMNAALDAPAQPPAPPTANAAEPGKAN